MSASEEPIQTLYINNLNDKLSKEQLKQSLYLLFSQFGTVLDIVALKTERMRGQAWVSYLSVQNATDAMNKLQGFDFYGKPMVRTSRESITRRESSMPRQSRMLLSVSRRRFTPKPSSDTLTICISSISLFPFLCLFPSLLRFFEVWP